MSQKIIKITTIFVSFFFMTIKSYAEVQNTYLTEMTDSNGNTIYRNFNGKKESQLSIEIGPQSSETTTAYSIDVGANLGDKAPISQLNENLESYLEKQLNNKEKDTQVTKKINEYMHFGYKYNGQNSDKYLIATQKLIWDELYNAGYRQDNYSNNVYFTAGEEEYDISTEENKIKNNISNYYKTPSMCSSANKLEIAIGETAIYEDTNKVLSNYQVQCNEGLTCKIEDNKLRITATKEGAAQKITFIKNGKTGTSNVIYQRENEQAVLVNAAPLDEVSCQFGIDTYKNVQTSGMKLLYITVIGLFCGVMAYIAYYTKKSLNNL